MLTLLLSWLIQFKIHNIHSTIDDFPVPGNPVIIFKLFVKAFLPSYFFAVD